jgi:HAD superfamily hydrolase (TIGR01509 family)
MCMIKGITFDLDGVYFLNGKSNFIAALGKLGVSEDEAKRVFLKSNEMNQLYKNGTMTDEEFWSWAAAEWHLSMSPQELTDLLIKGYEVNPPVLDVLRRVKKNGYKILACTNNFPARINGLHKRFKFLNDFDAAVFSYAVGASKPDKKIFQELIGKSGLKGEEIVFADDNNDNLAGAREVGIKTFFYEGFDKFMADLKGAGVKVD